MASAQVRLDPQAVEEIARRVAELLDREGAGSAPELVDAAELARRLGMERDWVYAHASELGAVRLGRGSKPRLRFDPQVAIERMAAKASAERPEKRRKPAPRGRRRSSPGGIQLLPIKGSGGSRRRA